MYMRISKTVIIGALAIAGASMAGCSREPDNGAMAATEAGQIRAAADAGKIWCALNGAANLTFDCSLDRMESTEGTILVLGKADGGFRRFRIATDGRGIVVADGAEPASVQMVEDGLIEVTVGQDRYRLPATVKPAG